jgi:hypothetical protein
MERKFLNISLNEPAYKKISEFAVPRGISKVDVVRTLIEKSDIKIDVQKYKLIKRKRSKNRRRVHKIQVLMSEELLIKMNNMKLHNNISNSEIVNQLIMQADLNSMSFKAKREKQKKKIILVRLDAATHRKIKEFTLFYGFNVSEVVRLLIKKSSIKIKDIRNKGEVLDHSKQKGKIDAITILLILSKQVLEKLRKMSLQNKASCSEILRILIDRTDLESLKIKPKIKPERTMRILMRLDNFTNKKIKEFSTRSNVSLSEIARVLIDNSDLKLNARNFGAIIMHSKEKGELNNHKSQAWLTEELLDKIKEAALHYDTSYSEILRILIKEADLYSMSFRTRAEIGYGNRYIRYR